MPKTETPTVQDARVALRGQNRHPRDLLALAQQLTAEKQFGLARRVLAESLFANGDREGAKGAIREAREGVLARASRIGELTRWDVVVSHAR